MASVPRLFQISGSCNNYPWGKKGHESLAARLGEQTKTPEFAIDGDEYYSELWFGDYPDYPARDVNTGKELAEVLEESGQELLGADSIRRFGNNLPFLPKILSIAKALPLQIHPNKDLAAKLHKSDPDKFTDANHKPEIAVALSRFELFAGWKELDKISPLFNIPSLRRLVPDGTTEWTDETLRRVVRDLLKADERTVQSIEEELKLQSDEDFAKLGFPGSMLETISRLQSQYSAQDPGLLVAVLCMNFLVLEPGQGLFIPADGVHCYLSGDILECMARSNNMLTGGLCPVADRSNIDLFVDTLLIDASTRADNMRLPGKLSSDGTHRHTTLYSPPISEFDVLRIDLKSGEEEEIRSQKGPMTVIFVSGEGTISGEGRHLEVKEGFIFFVAAHTATKIKASASMQAFAAAVRE